MTTIVLIGLGIVLAAAATLMSVHYGGDAMRSGAVRAKAATLENAAQNVLVSVTGRRFAGTRSTPASLDDLHGAEGTGSWMSALPDVSGAGAGPASIMDLDGRRVYAVSEVPDDVCAQVNRDYHGADAGIPSDWGDARRGCMSRPGGGDLFYVVLGSA